MSDRDVPRWIGIDHVQLAIPIGAEDRAREFYVGVLGLTETPKPPVMAARGGAWFEAGSVQVHVGAEDDFVPARKAHPALTMRGLHDFIGGSGLAATWNDEIEGLVRCHVSDPFGNRIELIDADSITPDGSIPDASIPDARIPDALASEGADTRNVDTPDPSGQDRR